MKEKNEAIDILSGETNSSSVKKNKVWANWHTGQNQWWHLSSLSKKIEQNIWSGETDFLWTLIRISACVCSVYKYRTLNSTGL